MVADALPPDPETPERTQELLEEFLGMGFTQTEAGKLADAWADPKRVSWWLYRGASHRQAVEIAT